MVCQLRGEIISSKRKFFLRSPSCCRRISLRWQKKSIFTQLNEYQSNVSYIGHQNGIKPLLTVSENLRLQCAFLGCKVTNEKIASVIEAIHLRKLTHTLANQLSAGQLRRLSLAHLLLNPALLWILDEPITALDTEGQDFFIELLKQHLKKNGMAIIATHNDLSLTSQIQVCQSLLH